MNPSLSNLSFRSNGKKLKTSDIADDEWETHAIVKVPEEVVPLVDDFIESGSQYNVTGGEHSTDQNKRLTVKFSQNKRTGLLKIGETSLDFVVQDLPCVIETYKTHDKTNIYKVADVSQMLNCENPPKLPEIKATTESEKNDPEIKEQIAKRDKLLQFSHGITPPMKNVRRRRWRKTKKKKFMDAPQVEQEIKRLLRLDLEAVNIKWEIIDVETKKSQKKADEQDESYLET